MTDTLMTTARPRNVRPARQPANRVANLAPNAAPPVIPPSVNVTVPRNNWEEIRKMLNSKIGAIAKVIPQGVNTTAEAIVQNALQQIETARDSVRLKLCAPCTVLYSVLGIAAAGLDFANEYAYLVAFERTEINNGAKMHVCWECHPIPGYKGLLNAASRHGYLLDVQAVYPGEHCQIRLGTDNAIDHVAGFDTTQAIVGVYCVVRDKETDRVQHIERMSKGAIDQIAHHAQSPVWRDASKYAEMAKKTVAKRGFKWLPKDGADIRALNTLERINDTGAPIEKIGIPTGDEPQQ